MAKLFNFETISSLEGRISLLDKIIIMKRKHWFLVPLMGFFLCLSLVSCETEEDKFSARPVDESELNDIPVGFLRFKWQGVVGNQQTLTMWTDEHEEDVDEEDLVEAPYFYRIGFGKNFEPAIADYFVFQTDKWEPIPGAVYFWNITSYYDNGDVEVSESRSFIPDPVIPNPA